MTAKWLSLATTSILGQPPSVLIISNYSLSFITLKSVGNFERSDLFALQHACCYVAFAFG